MSALLYLFLQEPDEELLFRLNNGGVPLLDDEHGHDPHWWKKFRYARYDWANAGKLPYHVILLTQGFFAIVEKRAPKRVMENKWTADVRHDKETGEITGVYAIRRVGPRNGGYEYLHRSVAKAAPSERIDHVNHYGLDNRKRNLFPVSPSLNGANYPTRDEKKFYTELGSALPRGVYPVLRKKGKMRFRARVATLGKAYHSETFDTPGEAHQWYVKKHLEVFPVRNKGWLKKIRSEPIFPPENPEWRECTEFGEDIFDIPF